MTIQDCKEEIVNNLSSIETESKDYSDYISLELEDLKGKEEYSSILEFYSDYLSSSNRSFFTITSKDTFSNFEHENSGKMFIYTPLNDHSRIYMHKGDVVFCYRQGQFSSLESALNIRGIYGVGFVISEPQKIYPEQDGHNQWGVAIVLPIILKKHLELRNIQLNPTTINLTPYNGNRNDSLQYIEDQKQALTLLSLIIARNPDIQSGLENILGIHIDHTSLPDTVWESISDNKTDRETIKKQFKFYLEECCKSNRNADNNFHLGVTAVSSTLAYLEPHNLFGFAPQKWSHIKSMYDVTDPFEVKKICDTLLNDQQFNEYDTAKKKWPSASIMYYSCFIQARNFLSKQICVTKTETKENKTQTKPSPQKSKTLKDPLQQIYYGAPGTGKSYAVDGVCKKYRHHRTTFHPDSDYSTFVGCYKPTKEDSDKPITYTFVPQVFTDAYIDAWQNPTEPVFLVIEEINRGNCAQIFGDLFQLLDRDDETGMSAYEISPDADLKNYIAKQGLNISDIADSDGNDISEKIANGDLMKLPSNLYIWATMNTSDQSLFPIDSAFKRRWDWKYIKITNGYEKDKDGKYILDSENKKKPLNWKIKYTTCEGDQELDWWEFIQQINAIIASMTSSADKQLGYFFCKADKGIITAEKFVNKVAFYLWNDVFKDYAMDEGDLFKYKKVIDGKDVVDDLTFPDFYDEDGDVNKDVLKQFLTNVMAWTNDKK